MQHNLCLEYNKGSIIFVPNIYLNEYFDDFMHVGN